MPWCSLSSRTAIGLDHLSVSSPVARLPALPHTHGQNRHSRRREQLSSSAGDPCSDLTPQPRHSQLAADRPAVCLHWMFQSATGEEQDYYTRNPPQLKCMVCLELSSIHQNTRLGRQALKARHHHRRIRPGPANPLFLFFFSPLALHRIRHPSAHPILYSILLPLLRHPEAPPARPEKERELSAKCERASLHLRSCPCAPPCRLRSLRAPPPPRTPPPILQSHPHPHPGLGLGPVPVSP